MNPDQTPTDPLVLRYYTSYYSNPIGFILNELSHYRSLSRVVETPQILARITALSLLASQRGISNNP